MIYNSEENFVCFIIGFQFPIFDQFEKSSFVVFNLNLPATSVIIWIIFVVLRLVFICIRISSVSSPVRSRFCANLNKLILIEDKFIDTLIVQLISKLRKSCGLLKANFHPAVMLCLALWESRTSSIHR